MADSHATCPYRQQGDQAFWARSVAGLPREAVTPRVDVPFRISRQDRIASAGSCFAQHLARRLKASGYSYFVTEPRHPSVPEQTAAQLNYEVFSARYGNIYTARQLVQLFDRAYGTFVPVDAYWAQDGTHLDAFRPFIQPGGFACREELEYDRSRHLAAVRQLFERLHVLVFTLGLTEAWRSKLDGAVYPVCPGCGAGTHDPTKYEFVNFGVREVIADLEGFLDRLARVNPKAKVLLTVSPVPLVATMEAHSVLVSTTYSKSVLRVAADEVVRAHANVAYFPSYEIITGSHARGAYFADDIRTVTTAGVDHVMRCFFEAFGEDGLQVSPELPTPGPPSPEPPDPTDEILRLVCDEEQLAG
jgi:hypothetical protein